MLKRLIDQLSIDMGMGESLAANNDGSYSLHVEPDLLISLRENPESGISLFTVVAQMPEDRKEEFLLKTMIANLFGRETGGATLGLDKDGKKITLLTFLPEQLSYRDFHNFLEDFVNYAEAWRTEATEFIPKSDEIG